ncbi:hypothetical protein CLOHAE12215_01408 [Clostridium haemolyticum]|uniref:DUF5048 domain-containing protein n=1 Tax=Clostridium haemolyticum TaxID=84025 RepID=UPI001C3AF656|nr:hypothetical protein [Clostridium haemolyticum]CAG7839992.1 hypothetical protein CLOHAE12215_01408 [Clostridium haemolyticum]
MIVKYRKYEMHRSFEGWSSPIGSTICNVVGASVGDTITGYSSYNFDNGIFNFNGCEKVSCVAHANGENSGGAFTSYSNEGSDRYVVFQSFGGSVELDNLCRNTYKCYAHKNVTIRKGRLLEIIKAEDGTYPSNGVDGDYYYEKVIEQPAYFENKSECKLGEKYKNFNIEFSIINTDNVDSLIKMYVDSVKVKEINNNTSKKYSINIPNFSKLDMRKHKVELILTSLTKTEKKVYHFTKVKEKKPVYFVDNSTVDLGSKMSEFDIEFDLINEDNVDYVTIIYLNGKEISKSTNRTILKNIFTISGTIMRKLRVGTHKIDVVINSLHNVTMKTFLFTKVKKIYKLTSQDEYEVFNQNIQKKFIKLQILNWDEKAIREIQGICIGGDINIDATQIVRRTLNIEMVINDPSIIPSPQSPIWLNKKIKVFIGIKHNLTNKIMWFNKGIYILFKPSLTYNDRNKTLTLQALDKMCWLNGQLSGNLQYITRILAKTELYEAIKHVVKDLGKEDKVLIDDLMDDKDNDLLIPYDIEKGEESAITDILTEIKELYCFYEYYYDEDGRFHFERIKNRSGDRIIWNFDENNLITSYENEPNWENVKNDIIIWGATLKNGKQIKCQIKNNDTKSKFNINKIGTRKYTYKNDKIFTLSQVKIRAEYELWKHNNCNEVINLSTIPIYLLDVNKKIYITNSDTGIQGEYLITKINFDLTSDNMNITAMKVHNEDKELIDYSIIIDKEADKEEELKNKDIDVVINKEHNSTSEDDTVDDEDNEEDEGSGKETTTSDVNPPAWLFKPPYIQYIEEDSVFANWWGVWADSGCRYFKTKQEAIEYREYFIVYQKQELEKWYREHPNYKQ